MVAAPIIIGIAIISLEVRKTEWKEIGFDFKDLKLKNMFGHCCSCCIYFADQYLIDPIASKFAQPGLPEIFSMKGNVLKLLIGCYFMDNCSIL